MAAIDKIRRFVIEPAEAGSRLDIWASGQTGQTRSQIRSWIDSGLIQVNGSQVKAGYKLKPADEVVIEFPEPQQLDVVPQDIPLDIVFEDSDLVVINKPADMVVHPAAGNWDKTLVNALLAHCQDLSGIGGRIRPGIVHRLDKDTSGLLLVAKNDAAHRFLSDQIKRRQVKRHYLALVHGIVKAEQGTIDGPIGRHPQDRKKMAITAHGRPAVTHFLVKDRFAHYSLLECRLETGRTHQIRVHLASIHHPIVGDPKYGRRCGNLGLTRQALHAYYLKFRHPKGRELNFSVPPPQDFLDAVEKARKTS